MKFNFDNVNILKGWAKLVNIIYDSEMLTVSISVLFFLQTTAMLFTRHSSLFENIARVRHQTISLLKNTDDVLLGLMIEGFSLF